MRSLPFLDCCSLCLLLAAQFESFIHPATIVPTVPLVVAERTVSPQSVSRELVAALEAPNPAE